MDYIKANLKSVIIISLLLVGIIVGVYLVQVQHIFKSRASEEIYNTIEVSQTTESGEKQRVQCEGNNCTTQSLDIDFKVNVSDLETLENPQE